MADHTKIEKRTAMSDAPEWRGEAAQSRSNGGAVRSLAAEHD